MKLILAFGLPSGTEWIFLAVLFLVFFGPEKIPQLARGLGKSLSEFKKAREELEREITQDPPPRPKPAPNPPQAVKTPDKAIPLQLKAGDQPSVANEPAPATETATPAVVKETTEQTASSPSTSS
jgi:sec-independent protein translocase protein TatA